KHLLQAKKGDYAVFQQGKILSLVHVRSADKNAFVLEEISLPLYAAKHIEDWQNWAFTGAKGASSWTVFEIDLENKELIEAFSYTKGAFLQGASADTLLSKLLAAPLIPVSEENRKKIGPPPIGRQQDRRAFWNPPISLKTWAKRPSFAVYSTKWPTDDTPLSGKRLELYFAKNQQAPFPCWIEVQGDHGFVYTKIVDAGRDFQTPFPYFPRRSPRFLGQPRSEDDVYIFEVFCPKYYQDFSLSYIDQTGALQDILFAKRSIEKERLELRIKKEQLPLFPRSITLFPKKNPEASCTFIGEL
ncbi:MAG: hypothetical protein AAGI90_06960, partial [Chlamydiota bacterium]